MILFEGGWLSVRHHKRGKPGEARMINLRYVDPRPGTSRSFAKRSLCLTIALGLGGLLCGGLALYSVQAFLTIPTSILMLTGSLVAFAACAYRTRKHVVFVTRYGRAPVVELMATLGSFRSLRRIVPQLIDEIKKATNFDSDIQKYLRSEMREHYRLRERGVLSQSVCTNSTQRILQQFK